MTLPDFPFFLVFSAFIGTYFFIQRILFPYIIATQSINRRLEYAGRTTNEEAFYKEQENLRKQRYASKIDSRLAELMKYTPTFSSKLKNFLYRSGLITYTRIFSLLYGAIIVLYFIIFLFAFNGLSWVGLFLSIVLSVLTFVALLKAREHIWLKKITHQFPSALDIINRSLKAGLPLKRGISLVGEEMPNPIGGVFRYMEAQFQIGLPPKQIFIDAATRVTIEDFRLFTIGLLLQQEMGGSLSDILSKLNEVLAEREKIRMKISVLSTEAKTSSWIVSCLPFLVAGCLEYLNPDYLSFFIQEPEGHIMLGFIAFLTVLGTITIRHMTSFTQE